LTNWFEAEFVLLKILRLQPSELDRMEFYRAEILIENLKNYSEDEEGKRKKSEEEYGGGNMSEQASRMMDSAKSSMPKFNTNIGMPNFNMPKMPNFKI